MYSAKGFCPSCYSPFVAGTGFEAIEFTYEQYMLKIRQSPLWEAHVAWGEDQEFCRQCVTTGLVDTFLMPSELSLQSRQAACPWLGELPLVGAETLFASLVHFWADIEHRETNGVQGTDWHSTKNILLELVQRRLQK